MVEGLVDVTLFPVDQGGLDEKLFLPTEQLELRLDRGVSLRPLLTFSGLVRVGPGEDLVMSLYLDVALPQGASVGARGQLWLDRPVGTAEVLELVDGGYDDLATLDAAPGFEAAYAAWRAMPFPKCDVGDASGDLHGDVALVDTWIAETVIPFRTDGTVSRARVDVFAALRAIRARCDRLALRATSAQNEALGRYTAYLGLLGDVYRAFLVQAYDPAPAEAPIARWFEHRRTPEEEQRLRQELDAAAAGRRRRSEK